MLANLAILAMAAPPGGSGGGASGSMLSTFVPLIVIFVIFYFLMIRPQQKQQKKLREMLSALKKGDEVVTRGGVLGTIHGMAENIITLEVAENCRFKVTRDSIVGLQAK